jgi:hypothetical protein
LINEGIASRMMSSFLCQSSKAKNSAPGGVSTQLVTESAGGDKPKGPRDDLSRRLTQDQLKRAPQG